MNEQNAAAAMGPTVREPVGASTAADAREERVYAKVTLRLLPFLGLCYLIAYLDRVNVGFAKLHMLADLSISEAAYGFGAGIFFIGYFLFEVPSNLILHRVGARLWIARITAAAHSQPLPSVLAQAKPEPVRPAAVVEPQSRLASALQQLAMRPGIGGKAA